MTNEPRVTLAQTSYSIVEAAVVIGKSDQTVRRYIKDNKFPNVFKAPGPKGDEYRIPSTDLVVLIEDQDLTIHLDEAADYPADSSGPPVQDRTDELIEARELIGQLTGQNDQLAKTETDLNKRVRQLTDDLEQERSERHRNKAQIAELDKAKAVVEARIEEVRTQLEHEQTKVEEHQAQLTEASELAAETAATHAAELVSMGDRATELEKERSEALSEAAKLKESMGWWAKRRHQRNGQV